ncbi:MAG TPA: M1 family metallopeptidase [Thermoanaerobaculia bacterium]|nr:M1 family metallopeptidase [Thermoanaerobaculia bacterium]
MVVNLASLLLLLLGAAADPGERLAGAGFDVERYRFEIRLSDESDSVVGRARIEGVFIEGGRSELAFDLIGPAPASAGAALLGMIVDRVFVLPADPAGGADAVPMRFRQDADLLVLALASPSVAGERAAFDVHYRGIPADGLIISKNRHGQRTFFADNWPDRARHWLPTVDHPSDKALVEFDVVAPDHYQVVANGALREESDLDANLRRTRWVSRAPLATKVMVIGVARFAVEHLDPVAGVPLQSWVYREDRDAGFLDYGVAARVLLVLVELLGPFPYAKLANVQSTTRYGGMENAGAIFYSERSVGGEREIEGLVAHEIAHQWFGDAVTETDWAHAWISEGFATYLAQVYFERTVGEQRLSEGMAQARERVVRFSRERPERTVVDARPARDMLDANTYQKGAWVLHMLRGEIGDRAFFGGLREVVERHRHGNAATDDVRRVFEEASGRDLEWFFEQWLERPGQPLLAVEWRSESEDTDREAVTVTVRQLQAGPPFVAPLELGLVAADGTMVLERVALAERETVARFAARFSEAPIGLVVDPEVRLLMELESVSGPAAAGSLDSPRRAEASREDGTRAARSAAREGASRSGSTRPRGSPRVRDR